MRKLNYETRYTQSKHEKLFNPLKKRRFTRRTTCSWLRKNWDLIFFITIDTDTRVYCFNTLGNDIEASQPILKGSRDCDSSPASFTGITWLSQTSRFEILWLFRDFFVIKIQFTWPNKYGMPDSSSLSQIGHFTFKFGRKLRVLSFSIPKIRKFRSDAGRKFGPTRIFGSTSGGSPVWSVGRSEMYRSILANQFLALLLFRRFQTLSYLSYGSIVELKEKNMVETVGPVRSAVKVSFSFSLVSPTGLWPIGLATFIIPGEMNLKISWWSAGRNLPGMNIGPLKSSVLSAHTNEQVGTSLSQWTKRQLENIIVIVIVIEPWP